MKQSNYGQSDSAKNEEGESHFLLNIGKIVMLVSVLVAAWFFLDWLIGGK
jgi:hypothetical protein